MLLQLAQHARSESKYARAIELARQVLSADPANEKAHQHLMFCYAATGNRAAALKQYDDCKRVLQDELGVEPSSETTTLYEKIRAEETGGKAQEALLSNLPIPLTSFVGRQAEIVYVKRLVETTQLLTLTGAGGCGKTRLAIQVATELAAVDRFKHGVWWVDLAPLNDSALVTQSVAMVFGLSESPGTSLMAVLTDYLRAKELLLVIDNCEHLLGACTQLIGTLLSACPKLKIVATSREVLDIIGNKELCLSGSSGVPF
jgi:tetratricopeptide (TPR) repeat protein